MRLPLLLLALGLGPWPPATGSQPRASVSDELSPTEDAATLAALDEASLGPLWVRVQAAARTAAAARAAASGAAIDSTNLLQPADVAAQRELLAFLRQYNATVMFEPGLDCLTCPRLATATERRAAGDTILRLPSRLLPALSIAQAREGEAGAFAEQLLRSSDLSASFFEHRCRSFKGWLLALWLRAQPTHRRGVAFSFQTLDAKHIREFEQAHGNGEDWFAHSILSQGRMGALLGRLGAPRAHLGRRRPAAAGTPEGCRRVWPLQLRRGPEVGGLSIPERILFNYELFRDVAAAYATRVYVKALFVDPDDEDIRVPGIYVAPGLDMLDFSLQAPNAALNLDGLPSGCTEGWLEVVATRPIAKGERVLLDPRPADPPLAFEAPDWLLRFHGWITDEQVPRCCLADVPLQELQRMGPPSTWDTALLVALKSRQAARLHELEARSNATLSELAVDAVLTLDGRSRTSQLLIWPCRLVRRWALMDLVNNIGKELQQRRRAQAQGRNVTDA